LVESSWSIASIRKPIKEDKKPKEAIKHKASKSKGGRSPNFVSSEREGLLIVSRVHCASPRTFKVFIYINKAFKVRRKVTVR
jgi:hypothetical protein